MEEALIEDIPKMISSMAKSGLDISVDLDKLTRQPEAAQRSNTAAGHLDAAAANPAAHLIPEENIFNWAGCDDWFDTVALEPSDNNVYTVVWYTRWRQILFGGNTCRSFIKSVDG